MDTARIATSVYRDIPPKTDSLTDFYIKSSIHH